MIRNGGEEMIECLWNHPDCLAARKRTTVYGRETYECTILNDCDFPKRKDCPFFKKNKRYAKEDDKR